MNKFVLLTAVTLLTLSSQASTVRSYDFEKGVTGKSEMASLQGDLSRAMDSFNQCKDTALFTHTNKLMTLSYNDDRSLQGGYIYTMHFLGQHPLPGGKFERTISVKATRHAVKPQTPPRADGGSYYFTFDCQSVEK